MRSLKYLVLAGVVLTGFSNSAFCSQNDSDLFVDVRTMAGQEGPLAKALSARHRHVWGEEANAIDPDLDLLFKKFRDSLTPEKVSRIKTELKDNNSVFEEMLSLIETCPHFWWHAYKDEKDEHEPLDNGFTDLITMISVLLDY